MEEETEFRFDVRNIIFYQLLQFRLYWYLLVTFYYYFVNKHIYTNKQGIPYCETPAFEEIEAAKGEEGANKSTSWEKT